MRSSSAGLSVTIHLAAVALMSLLGARVARERFSMPPPRIVVPLTFTTRPQDPGGGGSSDPLPPAKGRLPPRPATRVFVPPLMTISNPKLPVSVAMIDSPAVTVDVAQYGDPLGRARIPSGGAGVRGGNGDGCCGGSGDQYDRGPGGDGKAVSAPSVRYTTPPKLVYKIEPEYPDEARKARLQGIVVLSAEIDPSGKPRRIRVVSGMGLGMDERALEAVAKWRFLPALASGKPVPAPVTVEVSFRLL